MSKIAIKNGTKETSFGLYSDLKKDIMSTVESISNLPVDEVMKNIQSANDEAEKRLKELSEEEYSSIKLQLADVRQQRKDILAFALD